MSSPKQRAGFNIPRPYHFSDGDIEYDFGFETNFTVRIMITKLESDQHRTCDFVIVPYNILSDKENLGAQHRWLSENFRQHLLKFIKLIAFS